MDDLSWITAEHVLEARRELSRQSLAAFVKLAWPVIEPGQPYVHGPHIDVMCEALERVASGETRRLLINVPPGTSKSTICGVFFPMWLWGPQNRPSSRFVGVAHEQTLGIRDNLKCRRLASSDWYQRLWGDRVTLTKDQNAKINFENTATGFRQVATPSNITGRRGDCLLAGSMIQTEQGLVAIEDIVKSSYSGKVLSYDADTDRVVYRSVQAVARREASDFYRVHTTGGRVVECTGDHRIYTARGYVEARLLAVDDVLLRSVCDADPKASMRDQEGREARNSELLLQPVVRADTHEPSARQNGAVLQCVQREDTQGRAAMRPSVCSGSAESPCGLEGDRAPDVSVRVLQQDVRGQDAGDQAPVLFCDLQSSGPFGGHGGRVQSRMAKRGKSCSQKSESREAVQVCEATDNRTGRISLCGLSLAGSAGSASHRHERGEQCVVEFGDVVQPLPSLVPCGRAIKTEGDAVSLVERVCEPAVVYDIQVEGTRCFFANGILVHNCVIIDDPLSAENANSEAEREKVNLWFREALPTRLNNPDTSAIIVVMQRLHERDVSGLILSEQLGYEHLMLPMKYEVARGDPKDWRTEEGELLFPARFSAATVEELEKTLGPYATAGQLQQRPAPREGGLFKPSWFQIIEAMPAGRKRTVRAWDLAATAKQATNNPDWTAGIKVSRFNDGTFVIEGMKRMRGSPMEVENTVIQTAAADGAGVTVRMTQDPGQAGKAQAQQFVRKLAGYPVISKPATGDKSTRATPAAAQAEVGNIKILKTGDPVQDAWIAPFLDEIALFPAGAHDDQVDVLADAINELALGYSGPNYAAWA